MAVRIIRSLHLTFVLILTGAAPFPLKDEPADKPGDEGRKVILRHVDGMERESKAMRAKDPESAQVLADVAKVLRESIEVGKSDAGPGAKPDAKSDAKPDAPGVGPAVYDPEARSRTARGPSRPVKSTVMTLLDFRRTYGNSFAREANLARGGRATASGTHPESDDPITALGGARRRDTWCLNGTRGWFQADFAEPAAGRYLLLFNRPHGGPGDAWESAVLEINGRQAAKIGAFPAGHVLVADLGEQVSIKSLKLTIQGRDFPGITGLEIHRATRR
jgi:hypothetical protein